ncbi:MAG: molecular chaperone TorD family protein [Deltaproteobacteria bacterium]|nr:molecular chaperone TorD family protein [Deltaproteobacteria bacterium]
MLNGGRAGDIEALAGGRERLYRFLAGQFISPPVGPKIPPNDLVAAWRELAQPVDPKCVAEIVGHLETDGFDPVALGREFAELFQIPAGRYLAPIESVYRAARFDGDRWTFGRLRGAPWTRVTNTYSKAGFEPAQDDVEADHIACELQFLAELCAREREAAAQGHMQLFGSLRANQKKFIDQHPLAWVHLLRHRIEQVTSSPYYLGLIHFVENMLAMESNYLSRNGAGE